MDLSYEILRSIRRILRQVAEHSRRLSRDTGLTVPQLLCLRAVADEDEGDATVASVAARMQLASATVTRILDRLEQAGYLERKRSTEDRRRVRLLLTPLGALRIENLPEPLHESFLARVRALDDARRRELLDALHAIVEMMEAGDGDVAPLLTPEHDVKTPLPPT